MASSSAQRLSVKLLLQWRRLAAAPLPSFARNSIPQSLPSPLHSILTDNSQSTSLLASGIRSLRIRHSSSSSSSSGKEGGIEEGKFNGAKTVDAGADLEAIDGRYNEELDEIDDDGEEMDGDENEDDEDDESQFLSEMQRSLPDFKDPIEEAAYIGYKVDGRIKAGDFSNFKPPKAFAVVQVGSHQFKVSPGDCIYTEKLKFADVNDKLVLEKVLLLGSKTQTIIGRPFVPKAFVHAAVEEQVLDAKVIIFKKKRRKNYRRTRGHRQELTRLRILDIRGLGESWSGVS